MNQQLQHEAPPVLGDEGQSIPPTIEPPPRPSRRNSVRNTVAIIFAAAVVMPSVIILVIQSSIDSSTNEPRPKKELMRKVDGTVALMGDVLLVENLGTNEWRQGELIIDPFGERYVHRMAGITPHDTREFPLIDFATRSGDRFPAASKVPRMVMISVQGMDGRLFQIQ